MKIRFRIGPFTFGKSGTRLSTWRGGTGISVPLTNRRKTRSFGRIKIGPFSFYLNGKKKERKINKKILSENTTEIKKSDNKAYEPWTSEEDNSLISLYKQGKTVKELSEIFGRTNGAIRSRINRLLME